VHCSIRVSTTLADPDYTNEGLVIDEVCVRSASGLLAIRHQGLYGMGYCLEACWHQAGRGAGRQAVAVFAAMQLLVRLVMGYALLLGGRV
jgi:hypothetical protein